MHFAALVRLGPRLPTSVLPATRCCGPVQTLPALCEVSATASTWPPRGADFPSHLGLDRRHSAYALHHVTAWSAFATRRPQSGVTPKEEES